MLITAAVFAHSWSSINIIVKYGFLLKIDEMLNLFELVSIISSSTGLYKGYLLQELKRLEQKTMKPVPDQACLHHFQCMITNIENKMDNKSLLSVLLLLLFKIIIQKLFSFTNDPQ